MPNALIDDDAAAAAAAMNALRRAEAERAGATPIEVQRERYRILQRYAEPQTDAGAMYATRYTGPRPDRPVVNGRKMVSREELADFQRLFGADKTLRDLLNADRMGVPSVPSAMDPRARGMQGANVAPLPPGMIPGGGAGPVAQGRIPGEVERNVMNSLMALGPMMGGLPLAGRAAMAMRGRQPMPRIDPYMPDAAPVLLRQAPRPLPGVTR
jgi:hypothetical protein